MEPSGIVSLGQMGVPNARNLMERIGYGHRDSPELPAADRAVVDSAAGAASRAYVVLSIGPDARAVQEVRCGMASTLTASPGGTIRIEMSTIEVEQLAASGTRRRTRAETCWTARSAAALVWSRRGLPPFSPPATWAASTWSGQCETPCRGSGCTRGRSARARR